MFIGKPAIAIATMAAASSLMLAACGLLGTGILLHQGTFDVNHVRSPFRVSDNTVRLRVCPELNVVQGAGTLVVMKSAEFEGDPEWTETSVLDFEGTYDDATDSFRGLVTITGGQKCVSSCEGMDMTEWDYAADWTGRLTEYDTTILGKADFGAFDFTAAKVVVKS